jgi:hypothetical protein
MEAGIVVAFAGDNIPNGFELCDGRMLNKNTPKHQKLFNAIGTIHGGDANPNFQLPDYRGLFLRGVDHGASRDPEAARRTAPGQANTGNTVGCDKDSGCKRVRITTKKRIGELHYCSRVIASSNAHCLASFREPHCPVLTVSETVAPGGLRRLRDAATALAAEGKVPLRRSCLWKVK